MPGLNIRRNVVTTMTAFFVNIALTFIGFRLVIQQGGMQALGLWSAMTAAIYVIRLGDVGMGSAVERHIATVDAQTNPERVRGYLDTALLLNSILFLCLAVLGWVLFTNRIDWIVPEDIESQKVALEILPLILAGFIASNIANVVSGGLRGLHLAWLSAYLSVGAGVIQMGMIIALVPEVGVAGLAWAQLTQNILMGLISWLILNRKLFNISGVYLTPLPKNGSRVLLGELFSFSIRAQAVNLANGLLEPATKLMIGHSAGISTLGLYEMAYKIVSLPRNGVVSGVLGMTSALTTLIESQPKKAYAIYNNSVKIVGLSTAFVLIIVTALSPLISGIIIGDSDEILFHYIAILSIGMWTNALSSPAYTIGFAAGKIKFNLISSVSSLLFFLIFGSLIINYSSVYGAVIAASTSIMLGASITMYQNHKIFQL